MPHLSLHAAKAARKKKPSIARTTSYSRLTWASPFSRRVLPHNQRQVDPLLGECDSGSHPAVRGVTGCPPTLPPTIRAANIFPVVAVPGVEHGRSMRKSSLHRKFPLASQGQAIRHGAATIQRLGWAAQTHLRLAMRSVQPDDDGVIKGWRSSGCAHPGERNCHDSITIPPAILDPLWRDSWSLLSL